LTDLPTPKTSTSQASSQASSPKTPTIDGPPRTVKSDEVEFKTTGNVARNKTIELMYSSVGFGSGAGKKKATCMSYIYQN
jgi:transcription elongation factor S-II